MVGGYSLSSGNIRVIGELNLVSVFYCSLLEEEENKKDDKGEKEKAMPGKGKREAVQVSALGHQAAHMHSLQSSGPNRQSQHP